MRSLNVERAPLARVAQAAQEPLAHRQDVTATGHHLHEVNLAVAEASALAPESHQRFNELVTIMWEGLGLAAIHRKELSSIEDPL